jgi:hypothetical protein
MEAISCQARLRTSIRKPTQKRCVSHAQAASWKLGVIESFTQIVINLVFFLVAVPFTYVVASELPDKGALPTGGGSFSELSTSLAGQQQHQHQQAASSDNGW